MLKYWRSSSGFLPTNSSVSDFFLFLYHSFKDIFVFGLSYGRLWFIPGILSVFTIFIMLRRREYMVLYLCLAPLPLHFILSALELYPVSVRTMLYLMPVFIFLFSSGIYRIYEHILSKRYKLSGYVLVLPLLIQFYPLCLAYPIEKEELKSALEYVQENIQTGDEVYVYNSAYRTTVFY